MNEKKIKALAKVEIEIENDINKMISWAKACSVNELNFLVYLLRLVRVMRVNPEDFATPNISEEFIKLTGAVQEESLKYSIQLVMKYGNRPSFIREIGTPILNNELAIALHKTASLVSSKMDHKSLIQLFDIDIESEDSRYFTIDPIIQQDNEEVKSLFDYYLRIDLDNSKHKENLRSLNELLDNFKIEFSTVSTLFKREFGVSIDEFIRLYSYLGGRLREKLKKFISFAPKLANGNINEHDGLTINLYQHAVYFTQDEIYKNLGKKYQPLFERLTLNPTDIKDSELKYHMLTRKPFIQTVTGHLIVSPELLLDGLFTNTHYSFLEGEFHDEYKEKMSKAFVNQIIKIARKYGYRRINTEVELYEGKKQLGDIDLVLEHKSGHMLLIEAKNHALPLDVYFKDIEATKMRLHNLKTKWEKKVQNRINHLESNHTTYDIKKPYKYLIVSSNPELLSHYSEILCLTLDEFEFFLKGGNWDSNFNKIFEELYNPPTFTKEEMQHLKNDHLTIATQLKRS